MEYRFKADEWERLAPSERVLRCRMLATEAQRLGRAASPRMKSVYQDLSVQWTMLADEMERDTKTN